MTYRRFITFEGLELGIRCRKHRACFYRVLRGLSLGNCTGLQNPRVLPRVSLGYGLGYRILYPRETRTRGTGMRVGGGLMAGKLAQIWTNVDVSLNSTRNGISQLNCHRLLSPTTTLPLHLSTSLPRFKRELEGAFQQLFAPSLASKVSRRGTGKYFQSYYYKNSYY